MARQLRVDYPGVLYHFTARGHDKETISHDETDRQYFLKLFGHEVLHQRWRCYAYCLLGNHNHLLLETPEPNPSLGTRRLNGSYTQRFSFDWRHHRVEHGRRAMRRVSLTDFENQDAIESTALTPQ